MSRKEELKKMKAPDQFQVKALESVDWISKHGRELTIVVILAALAVGGVSGYQWYENNRRESRLDELGKIEVAFAKEEQTAEEKREALRSQIAEIDVKIAAAKETKKPADPKAAEAAAAAAKEPVDVSAQEAAKQKLQEQMDAIESDHAATLAQYVDYFNKYKKTPEGWAAGMRAVNLYLEDDKMEPARDILLDIVKFGNHEVYKTQSRLVLSSIHEDMGNFDEGLKLVDEAATMAGDNAELKPQILFAKGRLLYLKDAKDDARGVFDQIIREYATSAEADKARSMKFLLN